MVRALAEDYERFTLPVAGSDLRVLVQSGRFVRGIVFWTELLDERVRVFDIELDFFPAEPDGSEEV